jgi:ParB family chromosome partitioning protein
MAQKSVLGKGLASLLPGATSGTSSSSAVAAGPAIPVPSHPYPTQSQPVSNQLEGQAKDRHLGISLANVEDIQANHFQPRRDFDDAALVELSQSIKVSGIIQPLVVRKNPSKDGYELIAGERRLRAAKLAGLRQVPIVIRKSTDRETLELALVENIQRQNLNCVDEALAYFQLIQDFSLTQEEVADRVGKERATIANYLRLLRLPEEIIDDLKKQLLSFGHGKALLALDDNEMRIRARAQVLERHLSVRETEALVDTMKMAAQESALESNQPESQKQDPVAQRFSHLSRDLARQWSTKVEIKGNANKGKIVIHYSSRQDLDRILENMQTETI